VLNIAEVRATAMFAEQGASITNFPHEILNRLRTLPQALADLVAKHNSLHRNHPERFMLARMIRQLEAEIACRGG